MVREQWAQEHGLSWYLTDEYTEALAATCARYDVKMSEQLTSGLLASTCLSTWEQRTLA